MSDLARRWCRAVTALKDDALRAAYVRSELARARPGDAAVALDDLAGRAEQANPQAREALAAAMPSLTDPALAVLIDELRALAAVKALLPLARLLRRRSEPSGVPGAPPPDERPVQVSNRGRTLTLGERKWMARKPSRNVLDRLLRDPHPQVIRMVLKNPLLTEDDVVRLAARRPAYPDIVIEIARSPEWIKRSRVRMAIVQNPGSPPEVAVPLVRLLIRPELEQVVVATDVLPIVRAAATELLERRPPVPARHRGPLQ